MSRNLAATSTSTSTTALKIWKFHAVFRVSTKQELGKMSNWSSTPGRLDKTDKAKFTMVRFQMSFQNHEISDRWDIRIQTIPTIWCRFAMFCRKTQQTWCQHRLAHLIIKTPDGNASIWHNSCEKTIKFKMCEIRGLTRFVVVGSTGSRGDWSPVFKRMSRTKKFSRKMKINETGFIGPCLLKRDCILRFVATFFNKSKLCDIDLSSKQPTFVWLVESKRKWRHLLSAPFWRHALVFEAEKWRK